MSRALRLEYEGAVWHVTSRGNERRAIFRDRNDDTTFLEFLRESVADARWRLHAYVLMKNHYHLLVETPEKTLSKGVKQLNENYAQYFNWRHDRIGHLFHGRFKGILVERETHLLELVRYIVLNPVRCGAVVYAADYEWSNYRATAGLTAAPSWLETSWTLSQFDPDIRTARDMYRNFVADARGASYCPWESLVGEIYLGSPEFREALQRKVNAKKLSDEVPLPQKQFVHVPFDTVVAAVCREFAESAEALRQKSRRSAKKAVAQIAYEHCSMTFVEIGERLGTSDRGAAKLAKAGAELEQSDASYGSAMARIRGAVKFGFQV